MHMEGQVESLLQEEPFNEETMLLYFHSRMEDALKALEAEYHPDLDKWYNDCRDLKIKTSTPWTKSANHSYGTTSSSVDALTPRLVEDLMGYSQPIEMVGDDTDQGKIDEREMNKIMKWDVDAHEDLQEEIWYFIQNAV